MIVKRRCAGYVRDVCACVAWRHGGDDDGHGDGHGDDDDDDDFAYEIAKTC